MLNIYNSYFSGEQKDMAEFFIDLLSKMEEMSLQLKVRECDVTLL